MPDLLYFDDYGIPVYKGAWDMSDISELPALYMYCMVAGFLLGSTLALITILFRFIVSRLKGG